MRNNKINIAQYALFAQTFLLIAKESSAEVIYNNIDPDIILDTTFETCTLDLNFDGTLDFMFLNWKYQFTTITWSGNASNSYVKYVQWAGGYWNPENKLAGQYYVDHEYYGVEYWFYYPFALETNELISEKLEFQDWFFQSLAFKSYDGYYADHIFASGGYWFPSVSEQFLGVRFQDNEEQIHYGWIRCSVIDSAEGLIIHDFAYETEIEHPILAGSMESYVDVQNSVNNDSYQVYAFNKTIYIVADEVNPTTTYTIYSIDGKMLKSGLLLEKLMQVELIEYNGACLIEIKINNEATFTKHVVVF